MKISRASAALGAVSLLLVAALLVADLERASPGPLSAAHAGVPELTAKGGCALCHGRWREPMADACADCHTAIGAQLADGSGFHGRLGTRGAACGACHVEHHGDEVALVAERAFALAGVARRDDFAHEGLGFGLAGAHAQLECARCHPNADAVLPPAGEPRFLGLAQDCASCHDDPHGGRMRAGCAECHGQERPFAEVAAFEHGTEFALVGAHATPGCLACHPRDSAHAVEALAGRGAPPPARGCAACHDSPHTGDFVSSAAAFAGTTPEAACAGCHDAAYVSWREDARMAPDLHAVAGGFPLDAPHDQAACADCHSPGSLYALDRPNALADRAAMRRSPNACEACHVDPHAGQFAEGPFAAAGCLGCHAPHAFRPPEFDAEKHARASFVLTGSHREVACEACHGESVGDGHGATARVFRGTASECASCHADAHRGAFEGAACSACHGTAHFAEGARADFDHARWTAFALDGAHARAACEACHAPADHPAEPPAATRRALGFVADTFAGSPERCATCHDDVHRAAFEAREAGTDCAACHTTEAFRVAGGAAGWRARAGFDHARWTAFALDGAHARAECVACHGAAPSGSGRSFGFVSEVFPGPAERCQTCHADMHAGKFAEPAPEGRGATDCASCHSTDSFLELSSSAFDHGARTGFALAGPHASAACAACHVPDVRAPAGRRLGAAAGAACADCHADPHAGQFAARSDLEPSKDCAACHAADLALERTPGGLGFVGSGFDHARDARFALDARHAALACGACHVPWPVGGGREVVRYRPLGRACSDCHAHGGDR